MSKLDSILNLITLLSSRDSTSLQNIMDTLSISRRTVFRYLNTISEANFPVVFDEGMGGYRINNVRKSNVPLLDLTGNVLTLVSLIAMEGRLNSKYSKMISNIVSRQLAVCEVPLEEIIQTYKKELGAEGDQESISKLVTSLLVEVAIVYGRGIKIVQNNELEMSSEIIVKNPALWFKGQWKVVDRKGMSDMNTILAKVEKVKIL